MLGLILAREPSDVVTVVLDKEFDLAITGLVLVTTGLTLLVPVGLHNGCPGSTVALGGGIGRLTTGLVAGFSVVSIGSIVLASRTVGAIDVNWGA